MEMKPSGTDPEMLRKRFIYGNVLLGLALLHQEESDKKSRQAKREKEGDDDDEEESEVNIEDRVEQFTRAIAPNVLFPIPWTPYSITRRGNDGRPFVTFDNRLTSISLVWG
jgi:hypothetical protein